MRDKKHEALLAYYRGTTASLPADNPYRYLVSVHDGNSQHQGMQPSCPACDDVDSPDRCGCGKPALHVTAHEDHAEWACRVPVWS